MSSSGSEVEHARGYQPILAEKLKGVAESPSFQRPQSARFWPQNGVSMYHNELFTDADGDMDNGGAGPRAPATPSSQAKMQAQKSSFAARRAERMQANIYTNNESSMNRNPASPMGKPGAPRQAFVDEPEPPSARTQAHGAGGAIYGMRGTYDPNEDDAAAQQRQLAARQASQAAAAPPPRPVLDLSDIRAFLMQPAPRPGPVQCYIVRDKGSAKMYPKYNLFLEDGKRFLLAARKRKKQTTSNYLVSLDYEDLNRESEKFFGKLRANFVGTEFTIFDAGEKAGGKSRGLNILKGRARGGDDDEDDGMERRELGCVMYQYNVLGTRGPRKMTACIPNLDGDGMGVFHPATDSDNMMDRVRANKGLEELIVMRNKPPRWNEELNAYCLNFNGRVTEASVKNFQLVTDDNQNYVMLQFGKIGKNTFTMDFQYPMSALQAFCICLSSFDNKLACE